MYFIGYQNNRKAMRFGDEYGRIIISASARIDDAYGFSTDNEQTILSEARQAEKSDEKGVSKGTPSNEKTENITPEKQQIAVKEEEASTRESRSSSVTPIALRRTHRITKSPDRYSPSVYYVNDCVSPSQYESVELVKKLQREYKIRDLGEAKNYLGIEIDKVDGGFKISQKQKIVNLVKQYKMEQCKGTKTPMILRFEKDENESNPCDSEVYRSLIGSLSKPMDKARH
ncbi:hypothetical protein lerEdw1_001701 [Lerista edwardsae]|nr:hypothetical protein lerEdw1_001701 [Lerista edwardsae]